MVGVLVISHTDIFRNRLHAKLWEKLMVGLPLVPWKSFQCGGWNTFHVSYYSIVSSQASRVLLAVKNLPANAGDKRDSCSSPGWEDPLEEGMATQASILAWRIPMDRGAWQPTVHRVAKSRTRLNKFSTYTWWVLAECSPTWGQNDESDDLLMPVPAE